MNIEIRTFLFCCKEIFHPILTYNKSHWNSYIDIFNSVIHMVQLTTQIQCVYTFIHLHIYLSGIGCHRHFNTNKIKKRT